MIKEKQKIICCEEASDVPSADYFKKISRDYEIQVVFGPKINAVREHIGTLWQRDLPGFWVGMHTQKPSICVKRLITEKEIIQHHAFFVQCAKDYQTLATQLIYELAAAAGIPLSADYPYDTFADHQNRDQLPNQIGPWKNRFHGMHCLFTHTETGQRIEVPLDHGLNFGGLDPSFFSDYILSSTQYYPLPTAIYLPYLDGLRILKTLCTLNLMEERSSTVFVLKLP